MSCIGDAAEIRSRPLRKQKTDREDARLILHLLLEDRFPRIWVPSWENWDLRQPLWHRHRMVWARTRIMNQLQALALNEGLCWKKRAWREERRQQREGFPLAPWAGRRRRDLLELLDRLNPTIAELSQAMEQLGILRMSPRVSNRPTVRYVLPHVSTPKNKTPDNPSARIWLHAPLRSRAVCTVFDQHRYLHAAAAEALEHELLSTVQIAGNPEVEKGFGELSQTFQKPTSGPG